MFERGIERVQDQLEKCTGFTADESLLAGITNLERPEIDLAALGFGTLLIDSGMSINMDSEDPSTAASPAQGVMGGFVNETVLASMSASPNDSASVAQYQSHGGDVSQWWT